MRAITIQQSWVELIFQADDWTHPVFHSPKRVENRTWTTKYRGILAVHAGSGRSYLQSDTKSLLPDMAFGAIVGVVTLLDCIALDDPEAQRDYPWVRTHPHATGPFAWILSDARRFREPIPCPGKLSIWSVPDPILDQIRVQLES